MPTIYLARSTFLGEGKLLGASLPGKYSHPGLIGLLGKVSVGSCFSAKLYTMGEKAQILVDRYL